MMVNGENKAV